MSDDFTYQGESAATRTVNFKILLFTHPFGTRV